MKHLLLNLDTDVKQRSTKGLSLLHVISRAGKAGVIYVFVNNGEADINVENIKEETPWSYSIKFKNLATMRMVKNLSERVTLPRAGVMKIMKNMRINSSIFLQNFNP